MAGMEILETVAAVASGIAGLVSGSWYVKSKNSGHLFMAVCLLFTAAVFGYLAAT
jgi:hypothetical protein